MATKKTKPAQVLSMRLTPSDRDLLARLQAKTRLTSYSEVVRQGLVALARKEGLLK
ncbi:MAG: hypothetical protein WAM04_10000 [Candidatus Sulfotelmatobacter sp.]